MIYLEGQAEKEAIAWMEAAARVAQGALCLKAKCGSVIVKDNTIIGEGYNAPAGERTEDRRCLDTAPFVGKPKYDHTCCMHAEWRAIFDALKKNPEKINGATIYFIRLNTKGEMKKCGEPLCTVCSRLALDAGIKTFVLWHEKGISEYDTIEYNNLSYSYVHKN